MSATEPTPDATQNLHAAIEARVREFDKLKDGLITSWVLTGHILPAEQDEDGSDRELYFNLYSSVNLPSHVILGLLDRADAHVRTYSDSRHDEDDA